VYRHIMCVCARARAFVRACAPIRTGTSERASAPPLPPSLSLRSLPLSFSSRVRVGEGEGEVERRREREREREEGREGVSEGGRGRGREREGEGGRERPIAGSIETTNHRVVQVWGRHVIFWLQTCIIGLFYYYTRPLLLLY